jgi:hypothetical protein
MPLRLCLALALVTVVSDLAFARDIYVDNTTGDDRRGGTISTSQGNLGPCRSIAKALRIAKFGDRIVLANTGVPYRESITVQGPQHSGSDSYPFMIIGNGATLDGTVSLADTHWQHVSDGVFRTRPILMSYQQLFLDDQPAVRQQPLPGEFPKLAPLQWCSIHGYLYFRVQDGKLPHAYNVSCCGQQAGITLYDVHDVIIQDLNLRGFQLDAINCHDNVRRTDLVRLTTTQNGRSGISIGGSSRVRLDTCASSANGEAQVRIEGYSLVEMLDTQFDATTAPGIFREATARVVEGVE